MDAYKANLKQTANQEVPKTFRKQELTEKSRLELEAGGTVKVSGLVDKKGKAYQGYITWKPGEKPAFMFPKDYKAALEEGRVKPAVENEVQVAVNSEGKTVETTRNLKESLQSAQQRPTGEQKQQQERRSNPTSLSAAGVSAADFPRHSVNELPVIPSDRRDNFCQTVKN